MKIIYKLILVTIVLILFTACEKIVDLDLRTATPKLVINAAITEGSPCTVYLTKSQAFNDNSTFKTVADAEIILTDGDGNTEILREAQNMPGLYFSNMLGAVNKRYHIQVTAEGNTHEASVVIPNSIPIDETYIYEIKAGKDSWYSPSFVFHDPVDETNYYYTILYVNGNAMKSIYLDDDEFRNGLKVHRILYFDKDDNNDNDLKTGDQIRIEMQTLDKGMYTFYKSLFSVAADGGTNPITNFTGDVLGCFKGYNTSFADFIVSPDAIYSESGE
ncbi:MAG: DUF4249 domain-containing protein [Prevotella sp.]|jgi:hypothetical protein|nr:DUF4249 domain-containing protein [Prevotella sp.]